MHVDVRRSRMAISSDMGQAKRAAKVGKSSQVS
jgi:hypothetical protein